MHNMSDKKCKNTYEQLCYDANTIGDIDDLRCLDCSDKVGRHDSSRLCYRTQDEVRHLFADCEAARKKRRCPDCFNELRVHWDAKTMAGNPTKQGNMVAIRFYNNQVREAKERARRSIRSMNQQTEPGSALPAWPTTPSNPLSSTLPSSRVSETEGPRPSPVANPQVDNQRTRPLSTNRSSGSLPAVRLPSSSAAALMALSSRATNQPAPTRPSPVPLTRPPLAPTPPTRSAPRGSGRDSSASSRSSASDDSVSRSLSRPPSSGYQLSGRFS